MASNGLRTLIKVRRLACDTAVQQLASALAEEDRAARVVHSLERTIAEETRAARDVSGSDATVEVFAAWLPIARQNLALAQETWEARQAETQRCRAELTACRSALESVEQLHEQRRTAQQQAIDRADKRELDDRPSQLVKPDLADEQG